MTRVFMFPGQSSRYPGMLDKLVALRPTLLAPLLEEASERLGRDLRAHFAADNAQAFAKNVDIQLGVFLASHFFLTILQAEDIEADVSLGLSLGEWNHLVHIGALPFATALEAMRERGRAYDEGQRGSMASVFPMSAEELEEIAARVRDEGMGVVEVVNLNSPRQQVLSGEHAALERALAILEEETFAQATIIERDVPMHCSTFAPVAERFAAFLATLDFQAPRLPYFPNRLAEPIAQPTREQWTELLSTHVCRPVLWRRSIDHILERDAAATFVEVGPRKVLFNLLDKKWLKKSRYPDVRKLHVDSADDPTGQLQLILDALR